MSQLSHSSEATIPNVSDAVSDHESTNSNKGCNDELEEGEIADSTFFADLSREIEQARADGRTRQAQGSNFIS